MSPQDDWTREGVEAGEEEFSPHENGHLDFDYRFASYRMHPLSATSFILEDGSAILYGSFEGEFNPLKPYDAHTQSKEIKLVKYPMISSKEEPTPMIVKSNISKQDYVVAQTGSD